MRTAHTISHLIPMFWRTIWQTSLLGVLLLACTAAIHLASRLMACSNLQPWQSWDVIPQSACVADLLLATLCRLSNPLPARVQAGAASAITLPAGHLLVAGWNMTTVDAYANLFSMVDIVTLFGRSMGRPSARDQTPCMAVFP